MIVEHVVVGDFQVNCFVLGDEQTREAVLIDPGDEAERILPLLRKHNLHLTRIVNTHAHLDHVMAVRDIQAATGATFHLHQADLPWLAALPQVSQMWLGRTIAEIPEVDNYLVPGEQVRFGAQTLEMRFVPGHSPGSIVFVDHANRRAFVGDTLFAGGIGRTDLPMCDTDLLMEGIESQLLSLPDDYQIMPGHGPFSTVGAERTTNPFLLVELGTR